MNVKLRNLSKDHRSIRTDYVVGETNGPPVVDRPFVMTAPPLEGGAVRVIATSLVVKVGGGPLVYDFHTENSHYELSLLDVS